MKKETDRNVFWVSVFQLENGTKQYIHLNLDGKIPDISISSAWSLAEDNVHIECSLESVEAGILVRGKAVTSWEGECRRCLEPATGPLVADLKDIYSKNADSDSEYVIQRGKIDLSLAARDALIVELPLAPICRPDCKGLCPICGSNLNFSLCNCS
jgi:uncharacterized protein